MAVIKDANLNVDPGSTAVPMAWLKDSWYTDGVSSVPSWVRVKLAMARILPVATSIKMTVPHAASCS